MVAGLLAGGAHVHVVATEVSAGLKATDGVTWEERPYRRGEVAELLVTAGVTSVLNFAPTVIAVPPGVSLRKVDLSIELQILSFYQQRRDEEDGQIALGGLS
jgi:hypothetical protein